MKYLKLFENYSESFSQITDNEYLKGIWSRGYDINVVPDDWAFSREINIEKIWSDFNNLWKDFTQHEIDLIKSILGDDINFVSDKKDAISAFVSDNTFKNLLSRPEIYKDIIHKKAQVYYSKNRMRHYIVITKTIDEWYYVYTRADTKYYKCDQLSGLIECLDYIKQKWFFDQEWFFEIPYQEYKDRIYEEPLSDFTRSEITQVREFCASLLPRTISRNSPSVQLKTMDIYFFPSNNSHEASVRIHKNGSTYYINKRARFYQCNGMEGFLKCLEYLIENFIKKPNNPSN